ncbi:MAG: purine/pyrimidine permease [Desulfobacterales bacterium]|nr:purine/pyrimidine permease [Desulfobacterales bacterium]
MKPTYLYDLDDHPPLQYALVYALQWAFIMFPALVIVATLGVESLGPGGADKIRFLQLTLLTSGLFTVIQTLWGHRYPLLEGPATALVLAFILLAPLGLPAIQGGMIFGGSLLMITILSGQLDRLSRLFTPNVIGVILMLIALGLLGPLIRFMTGAGPVHPQGDGLTFLLSLLLVLFVAAISHWLEGFWKTVSILIGMIAGSLVFLFLGRLEWHQITAASWFSFPARWIVSLPGFQWPAAVAFACAYLAVMVNTLGSLQGIAAITDPGRLPGGTRRGILVNGAAGIVCGFLGIVGTVSYSMGPGVILVNRVASRYAVTYCGAILVMAAFIPKLAALLSLVPNPVVGAALCVAMGGQMGVGISTVASQELTSRDYFVVGLPVLLGSLVGFLPQHLFDTLPGPIQVFVANGLVTGIFLVLLLEHLLLRKKTS